MALISTLTKLFTSYLFPGFCLACGRMLEISLIREFPVCDTCISSLHTIVGERCEKCGCRLISEHRICTRCRTTIDFFDSHFSLFEYSGVIKELIHQYKFEGRHSLSSFFAQLIGNILVERHYALPIVPVPSSKKSKKKRGWDHINIIVRNIKKRFGIPYFDILSRTTDIPQKELSYSERLENLKGKIVCKENRLTERVTEMVLIDDVFTTGATASECARVLKNNGVRKVYVVTLAID